MSFIAAPTLPHQSGLQVCPYCAELISEGKSCACDGAAKDAYLEVLEDEHKRQVWQQRDELKELAEAARPKVLRRLAEAERDYWQAEITRLGKKEG